MPERSVRTPIPFAFSHHRLDARASMIALEGDLDLASAPSLKWTLTDLLRGGDRRIVVDLSPVSFIDSTALGVLVGFSRNLGEEGVLAIVCAQQATAKLFEVTGLDQTFDLFPTLEAAIAFVRQAPGPGAAPLEPVGGQDPGPSSAGPSALARVPTGALSSAAGPLTSDAAVVLGIASTALPFARSADEQAERWLRALGQAGEAAVILASLGIRDPAVASARPETDVPDRDVVELVTQHARLLAQRDEAPAIRTTDLLGAVLKVYGGAFTAVLREHGVDPAELSARLGLDA